MKNIPQATRHVFVGSLACSTSYLWCQSSRKQTLLSSTNGCSFFRNSPEINTLNSGKTTGFKQTHLALKSEDIFWDPKRTKNNMCWDFCVLFWLKRLSETHGWGLKPPFCLGFQSRIFWKRFLWLCFFAHIRIGKNLEFLQRKDPRFGGFPIAWFCGKHIFDDFHTKISHTHLMGAKVLKNERPRSTIEQWKKGRGPWMFRVYKGIYCPVRWGLSKKPL